MIQDCTAGGTTTRTQPESVAALGSCRQLHHPGRQRRSMHRALGTVEGMMKTTVKGRAMSWWTMKRQRPAAAHAAGQPALPLGHSLCSAGSRTVFNSGGLRPSQHVDAGHHTGARHRNQTAASHAACTAACSACHGPTWVPRLGTNCLQLTRERPVLYVGLGAAVTVNLPTVQCSGCQRQWELLALDIGCCTSSSTVPDTLLCAAPGHVFARLAGESMLCCCVHAQEVIQLYADSPPAVEMPCLHCNCHDLQDTAS